MNKKSDLSELSEMLVHIDDVIGPVRDQIQEALEKLLAIQEGTGALDFFDDPGWKKNLAQILFYIQPNKPYGTKFYNAIARLSWNIAFEAVALREVHGELQIYLRQRAMDDTAYPGEWHAPGSVFRPSDKTERSVADRLANEFGTPITDFHNVGECADWDEGVDEPEARGKFVSRVYLITLAESPKEDERHGWYPVDYLPDNMVKSHRERIIPLAIREFADPPFWR